MWWAQYENVHLTDFIMSPVKKTWHDTISSARFFCSACAGCLGLAASQGWRWQASCLRWGCVLPFPGACGDWGHVRLHPKPSTWDEKRSQGTEIFFSWQLKTHSTYRELGLFVLVGSGLGSQTVTTLRVTILAFPLPKFRFDYVLPLDPTCTVWRTVCEVARCLPACLAWGSELEVSGQQWKCRHDGSGRSGVLKSELDVEGLNQTRAVLLLLTPLSASLLSAHPCSIFAFERT